ncbi:MAG: type IV pilin N-terminal domain-containing protein [Methanoregula sp.]|nr:type IV pilin N-terminal domain-containing protein [Methanoregula sp.]
MKRIFRYDNRSAVSPVVGVMLMLVVTIIIAAVVSAFSGSLSSGAQKAPSASIDTKLTLANSYTTLIFNHLSGDSIPTKDLTIITYFTNKSGYTYKHQQTASSPAIDPYPTIPTYAGQYSAVFPTNQNMKKYSIYYVPEKNFGNYTWTAGDTLSSSTNFGTAALLGMSWSSSSPLDPDLKTGSVVDIKILHNPSGQYIYSKEVVYT